jgi:hypothetical protein
MGKKWGAGHRSRGQSVPENNRRYDCASDGGALMTTEPELRERPAPGSRGDGERSYVLGFLLPDRGVCSTMPGPGGQSRSGAALISVENTIEGQREMVFRKGVSGNPAGNYKGSRHGTTLLAEKLLADDTGDIFRAVIKAAKEGNGTAMRLCVERLAPLRKGRLSYSICRRLKRLPTSLGPPASWPGRWLPAS